MTAREWVRDAFAETYPIVYPDRTQEAADLEVASPVIREATAPVDGAPHRVLDVSCGGGRHVRAMRSAGLNAWGTDLSPWLITLASRKAPSSGHVTCADNRRLPFADGAFSRVTWMFNPFGYLDSPEADAELLREVARVVSTAPGAGILLETFNLAHTFARFKPYVGFDYGGWQVVQLRALEQVFPPVMTNRVVVTPPEGHADRTPIEYTERLRIYDPAMLTQMFAAAGFTAIRLLGDWDGVPFDKSAPRCIVDARR
jgi:SAM-dependent methyltransferase